MILLIDAVKTLISSDADYTFESWSLNKELADYLSNKKQQVIVVTNARWDRWQKIRELLSWYSFEYHSMDNVITKTEPEYWEHVMMYYGIEPENCFYIDHNEDNLNAAAEIGVQWELFINNSQVIEILDNIS